MSWRWWAFPEEDGAQPTPGRILIGTTIGLATTVVAFLVPQTLLIAVAFGTADYGAGSGGGAWFTVLSALVVGFACGAGAFAAARELRRAELTQADSVRTAIPPPVFVALAITAHGLLNGSPWPTSALLLLIALPSIALSSPLGAHPPPP